MYNNIITKVEKLSKDFGLDFNKNQIGIVVLNKKELVLLNYILSPHFQKYGKSSNSRLKNINHFMKSRDFRDELLKYPYLGGTITRKESLGVKNKLYKLNLVLPNKKVICYSSKNSKVLLHELIHALLEVNNIRSKNTWKIEAIVIYMEYKILNKLSQLPKKDRRPSWKMALSIAKHLKEKSSQTRTSLKKIITTQK